MSVARFSDVSFRGAELAIDRNLEEVQIRAPGLLATDIARGEDDAAPVGREGELLRAAERLARCVGIHVGHDVDGRTSVRGLDEQVAAPAGLPLVPVPDEQTIVDLAARRPARIGFQSFGRRPERVGTAREDLCRERQGCAIARQYE